jgi:hypothetical protein
VSSKSMVYMHTPLILNISTYIIPSTHMTSPVPSSVPMSSAPHNISRLRPVAQSFGLGGLLSLTRHSRVWGEIYTLSIADHSSFASRLAQETGVKENDNSNIYHVLHVAVSSR